MPKYEWFLGARHDWLAASMQYQGHDTFEGAAIGFHKAEQLIHASNPSFDREHIGNSKLKEKFQRNH